MLDNLNLPICPKCNDTKYVKQEKSTKMDQVCYKCESCLIDWDSINYEIKAIPVDFTRKMIPLMKIVMRRNS